MYILQNIKYIKYIVQILVGRNMVETLEGVADLITLEYSIFNNTQFM